MALRKVFDNLVRLEMLKDEEFKAFFETVTPSGQSDIQAHELSDLLDTKVVSETDRVINSDDPQKAFAENISVVPDFSRLTYASCVSVDSEKKSDLKSLPAEKMQPILMLWMSSFSNEQLSLLSKLVVSVHLRLEEIGLGMGVLGGNLMTLAGNLNGLQELNDDQRKEEFKNSFTQKVVEDLEKKLNSPNESYNYLEGFFKQPPIMKREIVKRQPRKRVVVDAEIKAEIKEEKQQQQQQQPKDINAELNKLCEKLNSECEGYQNYFKNIIRNELKDADSELDIYYQNLDDFINVVLLSENEWEKQVKGRRDALEEERDNLTRAIALGMPADEADRDTRELRVRTEAETERTSREMRARYCIENNTSLRRAVRDYGLIRDKLKPALQNGSAQEKLSNFHREYFGCEIGREPNKQEKQASVKAMLDTRRDSKTKSFFKVVATLITLGIAYLAGLWNKSKESRDFKKVSKTVKGVVHDVSMFKSAPVSVDQSAQNNVQGNENAAQGNVSEQKQPEAHKSQEDLEHQNKNDNDDEFKFNI